MALLFLDSFDHYSTPSTQAANKWVIAGGAIVPGRRTPVNPNTNGVQGSNTNFLMSRTLSVSATTLCMGVAYKTTGLANNIFGISDLLGGPNISLNNVGDGRMQIIGGSSPAVIPGVVIALNTWYYFELYVALTGSPGAITVTWKVFFNGGSTPAGTGTFTSTASSVSMAEIALGSPGGGLNANYDDFYITDGENLGDITIIPIYPRAAGSSTGWTPNPAVANYLNVNEHTPDEGATINTAATSTLKDEYFCDLIAGSPTIKGIQLVERVSKTDAGPGTFGMILRAAGGTEDQSVDFFPSALSYEYFLRAYRKSPFTTLDFTAAEINASQLGIIRTS